MVTSAYEDWMSLFDNNLEMIWVKQHKELKKITMIHIAFEKELNRIRQRLSDDLAQVTAEVKQKERDKCKKLSENEKTPKPLRKFNIQANESGDYFIDSFKQETKSLSPNQKVLDMLSIPKDVRNTILSPEKNKAGIKLPSPVLNKRFQPNPKFTPNAKLKQQFTPIQKTPISDSDIMESSLFEYTPEKRPKKKPRRMSLLPKQDKTKYKCKKNPKKTKTLTQIFNGPQNPKPIETSQSSMSVTKMLDLINKKEDSGSESDVTVDLSVDSDNENEIKAKPEKKVCKQVEVPKSWSCDDCKNYYEGLGLSAEELQKKKDECSKHRYKGEPRNETVDGFWDLSFAPTPRTQGSQDSLILNYKKP